ncbi:MAG: DNA cytosine methyltransferase [Bryobacteraceae bacterium]|nr:DNA cytosine methyltransferase [Bryobacteraceae bacterium]
MGDRRRWNSLARTAKLKRLWHEGIPRVLDLFAGCGGLSLGFQAAGFEIAAPVESDPIAAKTHALNFHSHLSPRKHQAHAQARDIQVTDPEGLVSALGFGTDVAVSVDVVVGGPPCQAFARVGRAKLREVATHPEAYRHDPQANLYLRYLDYVEQPLALLVEIWPKDMKACGKLPSDC